MSDPLLALRDIRSGYDESIVLDGISLEVPPGGTLAVLGRNGVGKTTLLLTVMGYTSVHSGTVEFEGRNLTKAAPYKRARAGLGWVPQERNVFSSLTVTENLTVAARSGNWTLDAVFEVFPRLSERRDSRGHHLSGGEQQMLSIARTLMTNPSLLLLDEPLEGLAPIVVEELVRAIERMTTQKSMALVLVEQHVDMALSLTESAVLLERGTIAYRGRSSELRDDRATLDRYVGVNVGAQDGA